MPILSDRHMQKKDSTCRRKRMNGLGVGNAKKRKIGGREEAREGNAKSKKGRTGRSTRRNEKWSLNKHPSAVA